MLSTLLLFIVLSFSEVTAASPQSVEISFVGDIMTHMSEVNGAVTPSGNYDFYPIFRYVAPQLSSADLTIGNLETVCAPGPYTGYPCFNAPDELLDALASTGFDVLCMANNHACDQHTSGFISTRQGVLDRGMKPLGVTGAQPVFITTNSITVALMAYTYGLNVYGEGPALLDTEAVRADLTAAAKADFRIVVLHWGVEYRRKPEPAQVALADSLLAWGANAVIGSHPHVIQPLRRDGRGLVAFSLGNFISAQRDGNPAERYSEDGVILTIRLDKIGDAVTLSDVQSTPTWVFRYPRRNGGWHYAILPVDIHWPDDVVSQRLRQSAADTRSILASPVPATTNDKEVLD